MKWTKKKIVITVAAVAVLAGGAYKYSQAKLQAASLANIVSTTPVAKEDIEDSLSMKAVLEGTESVEVLSSLHAEILSIHIKEGDKVEKGQLLATLDRTTLEKDLALKQNSINLLQLQLTEGLEESQRQYDAAKIKLQEAKDAYDQAKALKDAGAGTQQSVTDAQNAVDTAQLAVDAFHVDGNGKVYASDAEKKTISNEQAALAISRDRLDDTELRSQIDGTVTRVYAKVGRFADESENKQALFVIENIESLQMKVMVSEYDIAKVKIGQNVVVSADILNGDTVAGVVDRISPTGELKEGSTTERVIPVYIKITGIDERLIAGITAKAKIEISKSPNALVLPYEAIADQPDGSIAVYKVNEDNTVSIIPVTLGIENDLMAEVISDELQEGDLVILNPSPALAAGDTVNPV